MSMKRGLEIDQELIQLAKRWRQLLEEKQMLLERKAYDEGPVRLLGPEAGSFLAATTQEFSWDKPGLASDYFRIVGTSQPQGAGTQYFDSGQQQETTYSASGLPETTNPIFVRIFYTELDQGVTVERSIEFEFISASNEEESQDPSIFIFPVFGDDVLTAAEVLAGQNFTFNATNSETLAYEVKLISGPQELEVLNRPGTVPSAGNITVTFSAAELQLLQHRQCKIIVDIQNGTLVAERPFLNESIDAPDAPLIGPSFTLNDFPFSVGLAWKQGAGESLSAVATLQSGGLGTALPISAQSGGFPLINLSAGDLADGVYDLVVTATNGVQSNTASTVLTVDTAAPTMNSVVTAPTGTLTSPNQTVEVTAATPALHSYFLLWYTDINNKAGSTVEGAAKHVVDEGGGLPTSFDFSGIPMTGAPVYLEQTELLDDGSGNVNWAPEWRRVTVIEFPTSGVPALVSPTQQSLNDPQPITWTLNGFSDFDSIRIKAGRTSGASDLDIANEANPLVTTASISGHDTEANVYIGLYTVKAGAETLREERRYTASVLTQTMSGVHNNVGYVADSGHFQKPNGTNFQGYGLNGDGRWVFNNVHNKVFEDFYLDDMTFTEPYHNWTAAIELNNCTNLTFRRFFIKNPAHTREERQLPGKHINATMSMKNCRGITFEDFNTEYGWSSWRNWRCEDITFRRGMSKDPRSHHMHCSHMHPSNTHRLTMEECYIYRSNDLFAPYYHPGAMDPINVGGMSKGGSAARPLITRCMVNGGQGLHGSCAGIQEGPDYLEGNNESGGVHFLDIVGLDGGNKFIAHAGGNGGTFENMLGFQDDPLAIDPTQGMIDLGADPNNPNHDTFFRHGTSSGYHFDFYSTTFLANQRDTNFGKGEFINVRCHWIKNGAVIGFRAKENIGNNASTSYYWDTPPGNDATFVNCQFDADRVKQVMNPGEVINQKNWTVPATTRAECVEVGKGYCKNIPMWSGFGAGSMYFAGLNGET